MSRYDFRSTFGGYDEYSEISLKKHEEDELRKEYSKLRKEANLTQSELGEKLNITAQAISKWEKGEAMPSIDILKNLADGARKGGLEF